MLESMLEKTEFCIIGQSGELIVLLLMIDSRGKGLDTT